MYTALSIGLVDSGLYYLQVGNSLVFLLNGEIFLLHGSVGNLELGETISRKHGVDRYNRR